MKTSRIIATTVGAVVGIGLFVSQALIASAGPDMSGHAISCVGLSLPTNSADHVVVDRVAKRLTIHTVDPSSGAEREFVIRYDDPQCVSNSAVNSEIQRSLAVDEQSHSDLCTSMKQFLSSGRTTERGQTVNIAAGRRFVAEECS